jgi:hypothetical protein
VKLQIIYFSGAISFALGNSLLGGALLKAKAYKTTPIWFLIVGAIMVGVWPLMPNIVQMLSVFVSLIYAIGVVWLGVLLIRSRAME